LVLFFLRQEGLQPTQEKPGERRKTDKQEKNPGYRMKRFHALEYRR